MSDTSDITEVTFDPLSRRSTLDVLIAEGVVEITPAGRARCLRSVGTSASEVSLPFDGECCTRLAAADDGRQWIHFENIGEHPLSVSVGGCEQTLDPGDTWLCRDAGVVVAETPSGPVTFECLTAFDKDH